MMRELVYEGLSEHVGKLRKQGDKKYSEEQYQSLQKSLSNLRKDNKDLHLVYDKVLHLMFDGSLYSWRKIHIQLIFFANVILCKFS